MLIYFYSFIPLLFLPAADSSSIRDRNFRNDLVPLLSSRLDSSKKDPNSLKIVSNEPFIIQLQMPNPGESTTRKGGKEKDTKRKRPIKKRISKLKPLRKRHRLRRDLQSPKIDPDTPDRLEMLQTGKVTEHQSENATKNTISRADVLKALSSYTKKREVKKGKKDVKNFRQDEEKETETAKYVSNKTPDGNVQRLSPSPFVKMVYPGPPKTDKHLQKYSYKDLMSDRERLEKKIKYIRNMMNLSTADDAVRVRRRSDSDRTANKIAKMFLTLSAVNGLHDRLKSKCYDEDEDDNDEESNNFWEKEGRGSPSRRSSSSNEERYKVKKWIEHMKNKRSSSKTCPCMAKERDEESDVFPLEQKLPKNYYLHQKGGGSEESSEAYGDPSHFHRDKPNKSNQNKRRNHKAREDQENKLKALAGKGRKLELPLDDLELYRMKAKQILQNAEEILDKIKEEEERRLSTPNSLVNQLKELTSRIQTDPRNNENDLIRKIQKTLGLGPTSKSSDDTDGSSFLDNVKSLILDPYEKAKALTDESAKKLSTYLLRNLGELQEPGEIKEDTDDKGNLKMSLGQTPQKEEEKPYSGNLAKENIDDNQSKSNESPQNWTDLTLSGRDENKRTDDSSSHLEEQFKKRMEEIMKEQEKKLNEAAQESEDSSKEPDDRIGNRREEQDENETAEPEETLKEDETGVPLQQKKDEVINDSDPTENYKAEEKDETTRGNTSKESDYVSEKEVPEGAKENEKTKPLKKDQAEQEVLKEVLKEFDENEEPVESEVAPKYKESSSKEGEKEPNSADEENDPVELVQEKSNDQEEVAAATPEETETGSKDGSNVPPKSGSDYDGIISGGSDEKIEAKKPEQSKEDKSDEETILEEQEELEGEPNPEINSGGSFNKTPETVRLKDPAPNTEAELEKDTDQNTQTEKSQREIESETAVEYPDLLEEGNPDESLEKMNSNEEQDETGAEKNEKETLQLETPAEGHQQEGDSDKESISDETPGDDQLSKAVVDDEGKEGLTGATKDDDESKKEVPINREEQKSTDESPLGSEFGKETSSAQHSGEDREEVPKKPAEEASDTSEGGTLLKDAKGEVEETENSSEDAVAMKNRSNEKEADDNVDDQTLGVTATSGEEVNEKLENPDGSNEAPLKSALGKGQEPDKYAEEINRKGGDSGQGENDEDSATPDVDEETDDNVRLAKPDFGAKGGDLETLKERDSNEAVSEEHEKESPDEGEEIRLEATSPTREPQNPDNADINDTITKEGNSDERSGTEREDEDTLSRDGQELGNVKDETEEIASENPGGVSTQDETKMNREATTDGTLKSALEEKDEGDGEESSLYSDESDEKLKKTQGSKKSEVEAVFDDQTLENGDIDEEISLKAANNEETVEDGINVNAEDDEANLQVTLDGKDQETTRGVDDDDEAVLETANVDDDANTREGDENINDDTLMKNPNKDDQPPPKDADETPLKTAFTDEDLVNKEAEDNQDKGEGISDDILQKETTDKDDEESLEDGNEALRAVNIDGGLKDEDTTNTNKDGGKAPDTDDVISREDDLAVGSDGQTFVRAKNHESGASDDENPLRAANSEEFSNNINDGDETPLRATADDLNRAESLKDDSEESLREVHTPADFNNQIDGQNEDETPLQSVKSINGVQEESEEGYETLRKETPSDDSEESEDQAVSTENESSPSAAGPIQQTKHQKNPKEEITSENLQEVHPRRTPLKTSTLKVPTSIAKIMKDLEGQEKDDVTALENLNPEKIDYIIDRIDEVEQQNKVTDEVDCRKECACAEDITTRSRNIGRYEIVKDFLQWMKDLQLNRVLSDD